MSEEPPSPEEILGQFNRLIRELLRGQINRNTFRPWEVELLLDIESCSLRESSKDGTAAPLPEGRAAPDGERRHGADEALRVPGPQIVRRAAALFWSCSLKSTRECPHG